mgnify:FL=1
MLNKNYETMTKEELIEQCAEKDLTITSCIDLIKSKEENILTKSDIMKNYNCESDKALKILKIMFQMGYGNKLGKEYYVTRDLQSKFLKDMAGKEIIL